MKKSKVLVLAGMTVIAMTALTGCGKKKVDLNKYITFTEEGYDTIGTVSYEFDYDAFEEDYGDKIKVRGNKKELRDLGLDPKDDATELLIKSCVEYKLDDTEDLSNGDVVTLKWDCDRSLAEDVFNVELSFSNIDYPITKLKEVKEFNPFEHLEVSFSGISPNASMEIKKDENCPEMAMINYSTSKQFDFVLGETITVTVATGCTERDFIEDYGKKLSQTEKTYVVEGVGHYVWEFDEIDENMYGKMDQQLQDAFYAHAANRWAEDSRIDGFELVGNYLVNAKDESSLWSNKNYLYYIYKVTYSNDDINNFEYYWYGYYTNVLVLEDGTTTVDLSDYTVSESSSSLGFTSGDYISPEGSKYYMAGFEDLDTFFNKQIVTKIEDYNYKNNFEQ